MSYSRHSSPSLDKDYPRKTYGCARFHVCDGFYTIEELEAFLVAFRAAQVVHSAALARSMEPARPGSYPLFTNKESK